MSADKEYEKAHISRLMSQDGRPFSDVPLIAAIERAYVAADGEDRPTRLQVSPGVFHKLRSLSSVSTSDRPGWGGPIAQTGQSVQLAVEVADPYVLTDDVVKLYGYRNPARQLWLDTATGKTHDLLICAGLDDSTGCHDGLVYGPCGHENCYGQDDYVGTCGCICHG